MRYTRASKLIGLGAALVFMALAAGNSGQVGVAQADCTVTVQPGQSIQQAINSAAEGAVICLSAGTFEENIRIKKSLTLRGAGRDQTSLKGIENNESIITITTSGINPAEIQVLLEGLTVAEGKGFFGSGISVSGEVKVTLSNSIVSRNEASGLSVFGAFGQTQVTIINTQLSRNKSSGVSEFGKPQISLIDSEISGNGGIAGLFLFGEGQVVLTNTWIFDNKGSGLHITNSERVSLTGTTVTTNGRAGLQVTDRAQLIMTSSNVSSNRDDGLRVDLRAAAEVRQSIIEGNGTDPACLNADKICSGLLVVDEAQVKLLDSSFRDNTDWGIAAWLKKCGPIGDDFQGNVEFQGNNTIAGNNKSGNHNGQGNPGNHPFKSLSDGQVCLP